MKYVILMAFVFCSVEAWSQKTFSITIDSDDDQFFSVATGRKNYPSSSIGHLMIPGLKDSVYKLVVSFPRSSFGTEVFTIDIDNRDHVFQLKKNADKTWSLLDVQSRLMIASGNAITAPSFSSEAESRKSREAFAQLMASVVNDTSVLNAPVEFIAENKKADTKPAVSKKPAVDSSELPDKKSQVAAEPKPKKESTVSNASKDSSTKRQDSLVLAEKKKGDSVRTQHPSVITRLEERATDSSRQLVFVDRNEDNKKADTIQVIIPVDSFPAPVRTDSLLTRVDKGMAVHDTLASIADSIVKPEARMSAEKSSDSVVITQPAPARIDSVPAVKDTVATKTVIEATPAQDTVKRLQVVNSDCRNFATEADVDKLRVKMLSENNLEERVLAAKKVFRTRCFTTRQIRALTELFPSDKTRYEFFDAAYPFVSDSYNFRGLADLLTDEYYLGRFRAMVRM